MSITNIPIRQTFCPRKENNSHKHSISICVLKDKNYELSKDKCNDPKVTKSTKIVTSQLFSVTSEKEKLLSYDPLKQVILKTILKVFFKKKNLQHHK